MAANTSSSCSVGSIRIFELLSSAKHVLVAGIGGGYDFMSGLPIVFYLMEQGKNVYLANLSFSGTAFGPDSTKVTPHCIQVTPDSPATSNYFPEKYYTEWHERQFGSSVRMYAFPLVGAKLLAAAYEYIAEKHKIDAIVAVDGGTDSLMFGDEEKLGTPLEDHTSIAAIMQLNTVPTKLLACMGFGVDKFHGVSHGLFLENVAAIERDGGYQGAFSVSQHTQEGKLYMEAYEYVASKMQPSIVCSSIIGAMEGKFGDFHRTQRTRGSKLFINPLMSMYWTFDLATVAKHIHYLDDIKECEDMNAVGVIIMDKHSKCTQRKCLPLPM